MHTITQHARIVRVVTPLIIFALLGAFIHMSRADEVLQEERTVVSPQMIHPEDAHSFGYAVSGIVVSTNSVTVRALSNGTVQKKFVGEGSVVREGDILLSQEIPLLDERMTLQNAQNGLGALMQDASVIGRTAEKESARIQHGAASTSASLMAQSSTASTEGATSLLSTQVYGSVTTLVAALDFIDANESRFPSKSLSVFRETVNSLYGSTRTYLSGPVQYSFKNHNDILDFLEATTKGTIYPDNATLVSIATLVDQELDATMRVLQDGEKEFLDHTIVPQYGDLYTAYLTYRGSVIETQANLRLALSGARGAQIGGNLSVLGADTEHTLRALGYTTADQIAENARKIALQSDAVSGAALNILSGEKSLGTPSAPFDGVVDEVFVNVGEFVPAGTPLMTVVGSGAKELTVSIPYTMLPYLKEGSAFVVDSVVVGAVARFSQTAMNGNVTVVIELLGSDYVPGTTLRGEIQCAPATDGALALPRAYVQFDNNGSFIETESGKSVYVVILHDTGKTFIVKPVTSLTEKVRLPTGITF